MIGSDSTDDAGQQRPELVKLIEYLHWLSLGGLCGIGGEMLGGDGQFRGFSVAAHLDELGDAASGGV
ncbi:MAG: hypothetical protein JO337_13765 [Acidimicrobiales bacterium]|nr:hypothetical protein [Acidimicrobiales bacterium]